MNHINNPKVANVLRVKNTPYLVLIYIVIYDVIFHYHIDVQGKYLMILCEPTS